VTACVCVKYPLFCSCSLTIQRAMEMESHFYPLAARIPSAEQMLKAQAQAGPGWVWGYYWTILLYTPKVALTNQEEGYLRFLSLKSQLSINNHRSSPTERRMSSFSRALLLRPPKTSDQSVVIHVLFFLLLSCRENYFSLSSSSHCCTELSGL